MKSKLILTLLSTILVFGCVNHEPVQAPEAFLPRTKHCPAQLA